jgi:hypothetical protein
LTEIEGKALAVLTAKPKDENIKLAILSWYNTGYSVESNAYDPDEIYKITYTTEKNGLSITEEISLDKSVYIKTAGTDDDSNIAVTRIGTVLTDIENFSRSKYDLRKNNHLFARLTPYWKTSNEMEAKAIKNSIYQDNWKIGKGYAGPADFSLVGPDLGALESIKGEMIILLKNISTATGIPMHWLAYPELLNGRATAENLLEVVNASTKQERQILQEKIKEIIKKAMIISVDSGMSSNDIIDDFEIILPSVSISSLLLIQSTWLPLYQNGVISLATLRNQIPQIDPGKEAEYIEQEKNGIYDNGPLEVNETGEIK